jgi:hypothetical protein
MRPGSYYGRKKIRLHDHKAIRREMAFAYQACVLGTFRWEDLSRAVFCLRQIAEMDQNAKAEERLAEVERLLSGGSAPKPDLRVIEGPRRVK